MEKRPLGKTGMNVSALGFGGAEIGFEKATFEDVEQLLNAALDNGLNVVDTAECYPDSEDLIGRAVAYRRSDFFLFTKCGHASGFDEPDWDPKMLAKQIDRSLERLRTDSVDLIQLHSCSKETLRQGDVIAVLQKAREQGKTRFIGYSGDGQDAAEAVGSRAFDTLQTSVNIADQEALQLTLPMTRELEMGVIAKRPIANAAWKTGKQPANAYHHEYWRRLGALDYDFLKRDVTHAVGVALRFTLSVPGIATAIVGTKNPDRWIANAQLIGAGPLDEAEFRHIRDRWEDTAQPDWVGQT